MDAPRTDIAALRTEYELGGLSEADLAADPITQFGTWFEAAASSGVVEANAMVLATVSEEGAPSARTVLLKDVDSAGFVFFSNYDSRKGAELAGDGRCALVFGWYALQRQVRVEGVAVPVPRAETEAYFASRPRSAQLGAHASPQSSPVSSREELEERYTRAEERFGDGPIAAPEHWGGYRVVPEVVEFWQGRVGRLHDRLVYRRSGDSWRVQRLAP